MFGGLFVKTKNRIMIMIPVKISNMPWMKMEFPFHISRLMCRLNNKKKKTSKNGAVIAAVIILVLFLGVPLFFSGFAAAAALGSLDTALIPITFDNLLPIMMLAVLLLSKRMVKYQF